MNVWSQLLLRQLKLKQTHHPCKIATVDLENVRIIELCSTARNKTESPLLRLPGEIRNLIYGYVFTSVPYQVVDVYDEETGTHLGTHIHDRPVGVDLTRVCCELHHDTALLPFLLNEFRCLEVKVLGRLHDLLQPEQRKVIRKLTVVVDFENYCVIDEFLDYTHDHKIMLSDYWPNLEQVVVVACSTKWSSAWQQKWQQMNVARVRIMQDNKTALEDWLRDRAKEGFEVVFEEVVTKHGARE